ncbi:MAG: sulfurtransferase [Gammaproteobacteria bacterium]|nr:sulfurtransferase [Rhodocyclaceae bacterium]MBU3908377.1 sulfurtransferase [Gammaproteobacteria bacterium]MBU3987886.1 sulfurtransferase [Gammaproteobacteria bacterium]MBU4004087.1 sulfurtransferase [Gammaproteobacteria bacterium]MBU4020334.1 sulfurtransferase [Gammaproteobacteria bacterium]
MERTISPAQLQTEYADKLILDVRRSSDLAASSEQLAGALWQDPEKLADWVGKLPQDKDIVIYCVRSGSVSNGVIDALHAKGLKARFIAGGIEGWKAAGGKVSAK